MVVVCKNLDPLKKIVSSVKFTNNSTANETASNTLSSSTKALNTTNTCSNDRPAGGSDEEWAFHESQMQYREENPYPAEDRSRF